MRNDWAVFVIVAAATAACSGPSAPEAVGYSESKQTEADEDNSAAPSDGPDHVSIEPSWKFPECTLSGKDIDPNWRKRCEETQTAEVTAAIRAHFADGRTAHRVAVEMWLYDSCDGGGSWQELKSGRGVGQQSSWDRNETTGKASGIYRTCEGAGGNHQYKAVINGGVWKSDGDGGGGEIQVWAGSIESTPAR